MSYLSYVNKASFGPKDKRINQNKDLYPKQG